MPAAADPRLANGSLHRNYGNGTLGVLLNASLRKSIGADLCHRARNAALLLVFLPVVAWAQVNVDQSGGNGSSGSSFPIDGGDGDSGNPGGPATSNNSADINTPGIAVRVRSNGGDGGNGGDGIGITTPTLPPIPLPGFGGDGKRGGNGGTVTVTNSGSLTTSGNSGHGILGESIGGDGGDGGDSISILAVFGEGGDGGGAGNGGTVTVTNQAAGEITTSGSFAQGILAQSLGGTGGKGGDA